MLENEERNGVESTRNLVRDELYRVGKELGISEDRIAKFYPR